MPYPIHPNTTRPMKSILTVKLPQHFPVPRATTISPTTTLSSGTRMTTPLPKRDTHRGVPTSAQTLFVDLTTPSPTPTRPDDRHDPIQSNHTPPTPVTRSNHPTLCIPPIPPCPLPHNIPTYLLNPVQPFRRKDHLGSTITSRNTGPPSLSDLRRNGIEIVPVRDDVFEPLCGEARGGTSDPCSSSIFRPNLVATENVQQGRAWEVQKAAAEGRIGYKRKFMELTVASKRHQTPLNFTELNHVTAKTEPVRPASLPEVCAEEDRAACRIRKLAGEDCV
ncbi:hypothetical protein TREMEDRAFT_58897 [Tremella mesenterica DSM 1558]|uniref:uncharacterized protein n=1 Tax=Tremella mesenterica (strain ATCC 24925 / CBS 8224 / DSM 1558 / NBRC 9311 / NRRL Y-6157 / RJB 2259-6 / UBC 559-6) TaxID=578456 RepID=UPI0003F49CFB|nr:uncharacterized protein TREMEDRAFT_58897 [Tremella mesenterica DSM 1558]EIW72729.1 hypothetical protein TREMEDRAFT_58897 [Tremella mesenterica DSM 1558]